MERNNSLGSLGGCGIYCIRNRLNDKVYVGSSCNIRTRANHHLSLLRRSVHQNLHLQGAFNQYGESVFEWLVLEHCSVEDLLMREQHWIDTLDATKPDRGYNQLPIAGSTRGAKLRPVSEERRRKISAARRGQLLGPQSEETKDKKRKALKGRVRSESHRQALRQVNIGKKASPETRAKLRQSHLGKKSGPITEDVRRRISAACRGENGSRARLTWDRVRRIRTDFPALANEVGPNQAYKLLGNREGVNRTTVLEIVKNKTWKEDE